MQTKILDETRMVDTGNGIFFFPNPEAFHAWLMKNNERASAVSMGFCKKGSGRPGITYSEALDEALCFGWIDGVRKNVDAVSYTIRFTPRKARSIWSEVNRKRAAELIVAGRMRPSGMEAFQLAKEILPRQYSYENAERELSPSYREALVANGAAWDFFRGQAPSYQRVARFWVMSAKKEETRLRRLALLIEDSARGRKLAAYTLEKRDRSGRA